MEKNSCFHLAILRGSPLPGTVKEKDKVIEWERVGYSKRTEECVLGSGIQPEKALTQCIVIHLEMEHDKQKYFFLFHMVMF